MFGQGFNSGFFGDPPCFTDTTDIFKDRSGVALYTLDYDASDSGGATGKYKEGAVFNGSSSQIDTTATLIPNSTDFSISFWVKPENQSACILARGLVTAGSNAWGFAVNFNNSANKFSFLRHTGGAYANEHYAETATNSITVGVWQHVVLSFDKSTGTPQFYIDGSAVTTNIVTYAGGTGSAMATGNIAFNSSYDGGLYRLGNRTNGGLSTSRLKGALDHFRVFNKVVSASEVATLYSDATDTAQVLGDTSCTAFYNFNNNAYDLAGSNNPSSVSNIIYKYGGISTNVDFGVGGKSLYGARFNGSSSYIELPSLGLSRTSDNTVSFWVYPKAQTNNNPTLLSLWTDLDLEVRLSSSLEVQTTYRSGNSWAAKLSGLNVNLNQWNFVSVSYEYGAGFEFFVNSNTATQSFTGTIDDSSGNSKIGTYANFTNGYFNGSIDQVRIFNKKLSSSEVSKLYRNGTGEIACEYTATTTDVNYPVANTVYYKLDNNSKSELATPHYLFLSDAGALSTSARLNSVDSEFTYARPAGYSEWGGSWDPNNKAGSATQTFEESNKKWTKTGGYYNSVWGTNKHSSGKYYAEIEFLNADLIYGISRLTTADTYSANLTNNSLAYASYAAYSWIYTSNSNQGFTLSVNDVVGFAADFDNRTLQVYKNNVLQKTVSIAAPDGTDTNVQYRFGRYGQAAVFNGSSSKIVLPNSSLGLNDPSNFSFSCWFKTNSSTQDNQGIIWLNGSNAGARFGVGINSTSQGGDTSVYFGVGTSSFAYINSGTGAFVANKWVHIAAIKSSTTGISLYVDNVLKATNTGATGAASVTATGDNRIGGYKTGAESSWFNGSIDQVRIFPTALTSSQVTELYNEKPEVDTSNFKTVLYNGNSSTNYISNVGFRPDLVWTKPRTNTGWHWVANSIVGGTLPLASNAANSSVTRNDHIQSFDANGFTLGPDGTSNSNGIPTVAWCWKGGGNAVAGTGSGVTNVSVSANTEAGFSIVKYTGGNSASDTVNHGLTDAEMIILKDLDDGSNNWRVWHKDLTTNYWLYLNLTNAQASAATDGGIRNVDSNNFGFINGTTAGVEGVNSSASNYIAYIWKSVAGYSKIGTYTGSNPTKTTVTLGFEPSWIMIKSKSHAYGWYILDSKRSPTGNWDEYLYANDPAAEGTSGGNWIKPTSNGFETNATGGSVTNANGVNYIYMAFK